MQANPHPDPTLRVPDAIRRVGIARVTMLPRKSAKHITASPVPQTDTRGRVEYTKALRDSWLRN